MSKKAQNFFLLFGLAVLAVMVSQLDFQEAWRGMCHAGYWFVAVVVLWAFLYVFNAAAWFIIIRSDGSPETRKLSFSRIYRLTVSGFALNYATPGGLMGGEPYRIMSISPVIGKEKASSSVILYAMTHMFSHSFLVLDDKYHFVSRHPDLDNQSFHTPCPMYRLLFSRALVLYGRLS